MNFLTIKLALIESQSTTIILRKLGWHSNRQQRKRLYRSFLGRVNYYCAHIPLFAAILAPLSNLTRKGQPNKVQWGEAQERAFLTLQEHLLKKPILKLPDHQKPFILQTDVSNCVLGASLMQEHNDKLYPVAYASKKLSLAECKYSTLERECLTIAWRMTKFPLYLQESLLSCKQTINLYQI